MKLCSRSANPSLSYVVVVGILTPAGVELLKGDSDTVSLEEDAWVGPFENRCLADVAEVGAAPARLTEELLPMRSRAPSRA